MKIDRLDLLKFGHFTDLSLDLSHDGVHIIVGRNEAGKTTAMAAIQQLLFGFPVRSQHAYIHELRDLTIGGLLRDEAGEPLEIVRVKRQTDTLRTPDGGIIPENHLSKYLHDVDSKLFTSLFSVGHDEIVRGGEALLNTDGEVGRALFSASRGAANLDAALRKLDDRAAAIYKPSASIPALNAAIRDFKTKSDEARRLSASPAEAVALDRDLQTAIDAYSATTANRRANADRRAIFERVRSARPLLASLTALQAQRQALEEAGKLVDPSVEDRFDDAVNRRSTARSRQSTETATVNRLETQLAGLHIDIDLIGKTDEIESLVAETGSYRVNLKDLPGLHRQVGNEERERLKLLSALPPATRTAAEGGTAITVAQSARLQELSEERHTLQGALDQALVRRDDVDDTLKESRKRLTAQPAAQDAHALATLVERLKVSGDQEASHAADVQRVDTADTALANAVTALGLDPDQRSSIDALQVPTIDAIRTTGTELEHLTGIGERIKDDIDVQLTAIDADADALERLLDEKHPRTQDELTDARTRRDTGWTHVVADWIDHTPDVQAAVEWAHGATLADAYTTAVGHADQVADDLRADAAAVATRAALEASLIERKGKLRQLENSREQNNTARQTLQTAWEESWTASSIKPTAPRTMESWHEQFRSAAKDAIALRSLAAEAQKSGAAIERARADLVAALIALGVTPPAEFGLNALRDYASSTAEAQRIAVQNRSALAETISDLETKQDRLNADVTTAEANIDAWTSNWNALLTAIGLPIGSSPAEATAVLKTLDAVTEAKRAHAEYSLRVDGIEKRNLEISTRVNTVLRALPPHKDLLDSAPDVAITTLGKRLQAAQTIATEHRATSDERTAHTDALDDANRDLAGAEHDIAALLASADVSDEESLAAAITRSRQHIELVQRIYESEESLRHSSGRTVEAITAEAAELVLVEIEPEIDEIDRAIDEFDIILKGQGNRVGELTEKRSLLTPRGDAADMANEAEQVLSTVASLGNEYVEILLARHLLENEIDEYRKTHQGPILARASHLFSTLTLRRYVGLDSDTDEKSRPVLLARTSEDKLLDINALSTGARDQIYLSLRLAALEQLIDRRGSIPIILDDLFVHFDDERTKAGLEVLDEISERAQVLLFTHHEQVAVQAGTSIANDRVTIHHLP